MRRHDFIFRGHKPLKLRSAAINFGTSCNSDTWLWNMVNSEGDHPGYINLKSKQSIKFNYYVYLQFILASLDL